MTHCSLGGAVAFICHGVEDFYCSKYALFKYNHCEYNHFCIKLFYYYNRVFACVQRGLHRNGIEVSMRMEWGRHMVGLHVLF